MFTPASDIRINTRHDLFMIPDALARRLEKIKLQHRAEKYRDKEDPGGISYIRRNVKPGDTVFDIGAHKGGYLYFFLEQAGKTGRIYAFEPQSLLYTYLTRLQQLLHWTQVTIEAAAVSAGCGTAWLCVPENHGRPSSPCATLIESKTNFTFQLREEVKTISLDEYCRHLRLKPDFIKVDVEGNEYAVFRGAEAVLRKYRPKILFESETRFVGADKVMETFDFLSNLGYKGYFIEKGNIQPIANFDIALHQNIYSGNYCNNFIFE